MKLILLIFKIIVSASICFSQSIYFPAIGDGAQNPKAEFGYLESVPVEIRAKNIDTLFCNNGVIKMKSRKLYDYNVVDYYIIPEGTGLLTVTLISTKYGKSDTISSSITIVNRPKIKLVVHQENDIYKLNLIDEENNIVTNKFYCSMEIKLISKSNLTGMITNKWKEGLHINDIVPKDIRKEHVIERLVFNTTAVYSKEYGLYTGNYSCSIKIKN